MLDDLAIDGPIHSSFGWLTFTTLNYSQGSWSLGLRREHLPTIDPAPSAGSDV